MTYRSLIIEEHLDAASASALYTVGANGRRFGSLNAYTWTLSAAAFAKTHNLATDYVDNCWARVALPAALLKAFLEQGRAGDPDSHRLVDRIVEGRWFVINEEEF